MLSLYLLNLLFLTLLVYKALLVITATAQSTTNGSEEKIIFFY